MTVHMSIGAYYEGVKRVIDSMDPSRHATKMVNASHRITSY